MSSAANPNRTDATKPVWNPQKRFSNPDPNSATMSPARNAAGGPLRRPTRRYTRHATPTLRATTTAR